MHGTQQINAKGINMQSTTPDEPPIVRSLEELFRPIWLKRIKTWLRRLRRCMRLVANGESRKARRMRPPDLWVGGGGREHAARVQHVGLGSHRPSSRQASSADGEVELPS